MIAPFIDDLKARIDSTLRSVVFGAVAAAALSAAAICGAVVLFLWVSQTYGVMEAWTALAALFGSIAVIALIALSASRGGQRRRELIERAKAAEEPAKSQSFLQDPSVLLKDPAMLLTGLQIVRLIGVRRLLPLLLVGGVAAGFLLSRSDEAEVPDDFATPAE